MTPTPTMERDSLVARLEALREGFRELMLKQSTTGLRKTYTDGFAMGLCCAIEGIDGTLREAAAALSRPEQVVKALEWQLVRNGKYIGLAYRADSILGEYLAQEGCAYFDNQLIEGSGPTFATAKAAAQADYESRIRSCLTTAAPLQADASAPASPAIGVQAVKALEWPNAIKRGQRNKSAGGLITYTIAHYGGSEPDSGVVYRWAVEGGSWNGPMFSYEQAIRAAQADYEQRILSALHPAPEAASAEAAGETDDYDPRIAELQEIQDGAWGDNPMVRGAARDLIASRVTPSDTAPSQKGVSDGVREALEAELAELEAANEVATSWGAAVGARQERINHIRSALVALSQDPVPATAEERAASKEGA